MSKRTNIADAMRDAARSTHVRSVATLVETPAQTQIPTETSPKSVAQPSRSGTKAVTGHFPPAVRYQLKLLAAEQGRTMEDMLAEALNMLFAAYNKPEIVPTSKIGNT